MMKLKIEDFYIMENEIYNHVRVTLYDKPALYDAIWDCSINALTGPIKIMMSAGNSKEVSKDKFILTRQQQDQLLDNPTGLYITCSPEQIMLYSHNCIDVPTFRRIFNGENPEWKMENSPNFY